MSAISAADFLVTPLMKALCPETNGAGGGREGGLNLRDFADALNHLKSALTSIDLNDLVERAQLVCKPRRNSLRRVISAYDEGGATCIADALHCGWSARNMEGSPTR